MIYTFDSFNNKLHEKFPLAQFQLLQFNGIKRPASILCTRCNKQWNFAEADKIFDRARRGLSDVCRNCENTMQRGPRDKAIEKLQLLLPTLSFMPVEQITWTHTALLWQCKKCGRTFRRSINNVLNGHARFCPFCEHRSIEYTFSELQEKSYLIWGDEYTLLEKDKTDYVKLLVRHNKCGFIWQTRQLNFLRGHGCPHCKQSRGEYAVEKWLKAHHLNFNAQSHLLLDEDTRLLTFDFYLEKNQHYYAIEYNGRQHYQAIEYFGGEEAFIQQQQRDARKQKYCEEHNIDLIIIPYTQESILSDILAQRLGDQVVED